MRGFGGVRASQFERRLLQNKILRNPEPSAPWPQVPAFRFSKPQVISSQLRCSRVLALSHKQSPKPFSTAIKPRHARGKDIDWALGKRMLKSLWHVGPCSEIETRAIEDNIQGVRI